MKKACLVRNGEVWTLTYTLSIDKLATIHNFDNQDNDGYMFREELSTLDEVKTSDRIATHIVVDGETYEIVNKQDVYTYKQPL